jgi:hypothetical protein
MNGGEHSSYLASTSGNSRCGLHEVRMSMNIVSVTNQNLTETGVQAFYIRMKYRGRSV